jgi:MFS transporter, DHA2 family, multidrug resistance protein
VDSTQAEPVEQAGRREWLGLAVLTLPVLLMSVDLSVLFLALPHLAADLSASSTEQLWILDIYGFLIAGLLITMGTLGDRIGRRKLLMIGGAAFGVASVAAAFAPNPETLILARAALGIAGATLAPSTLALITNMFRDPKQRAAAVGIWMTCFMGGAIIGPIVGGVMLNSFWWGSVFLLAVPVMVLLLVAGPTLLPEYRNPNAGRLDLISVALSLPAILPVIYGIKEVAREGWGAGPILAILIGIAFGVVFIVRQRRLADPLLDLSLFSNSIYRNAFVLALLGGLTMAGALLLINLYLQTVKDLSPLKAGLWLVPPALAMIFTIMVGSGVAQKVRPAFVMAGGLLLSAGGYLVLTQVEATSGIALVVVGFAIANGGVGPATALGYNMVLSAAPPEKAGSASSIMETGGQLGVALGIAIMGSIGTAVYRSELTVPDGVPAEAAEAAEEGVVTALTAAQSLPGDVAGQLMDAARTAFTSGLQVVVLVAALTFIGLAVMAAVTLRGVEPTAAQPPGGPGAAPAGAGDAAAGDATPTAQPAGS